MVSTKPVIARHAKGYTTAPKFPIPPWPRPLLALMVGLLLIANIVNLGADLAAMGAAVGLLIGGPLWLYTLLFGAFCVIVEVWLSYERYASVLK